MSVASGPPDPGVPRSLFSAETGRPFSTCVDCGTDLAATGMPYGIEKVVRNGEVVFEYAICTRCTFDLAKEFSKESLERMASWVDARRDALVEPDPDDFAAFIHAVESGGSLTQRELAAGNDPGTHCQRCGRIGDDFREEHTVVGILVGGKVIAPVNAICGRCTDGVDEILSQKTREAHDGFVRDRFPGVPADLDLPVGLFAL